VRVSLAATQYESEINNIQAQPRTVFQRMRGKAADVAVPIHTGVAIVRLRRDVGSRHPRKPLYCMMGLQAGFAEPTLVNVTKRYPIRTARDNRTHGVLPFYRL
jgi:hypothetical protein